MKKFRLIYKIVRGVALILLCTIVVVNYTINVWISLLMYLIAGITLVLPILEEDN